MLTVVLIKDRLLSKVFCSFQENQASKATSNSAALGNNGSRTWQLATKKKLDLYFFLSDIFSPSTFHTPTPSVTFLAWRRSSMGSGCTASTPGGSASTSCTKCILQPNNLSESNQASEGKGQVSMLSTLLPDTADIATRVFST
jgi:hypothetical protein